MANFGKNKNSLIKRIFSFINSDHERIIIGMIVLLSLVLRFYNYDQRWVFNQDDARDAIIARYSLSERVAPLIGPPSSAGPFSFGPLYYWVVIMFSVIFQSLVNGPWFGFTLLSTLSPLILFYAAKKSGGLVFATIVGTLSALSPPGVDFSSGMSNPILSGFAVFLLIYSVISYLDRGHEKYSLLLGLALGLSINSHLQSSVLVFVIPIILVVSKFGFKKRILSFFVSSMSLEISFLPLIIFNLKNNWVWVKSVIDYLLYGQGRFFIPIRWLTDIFNFWPELLGKVVVGNERMGVYIVLFGLAATGVGLWKKWITRDIVVIAITLIFQVIAIRYYKGARLPVYFLFVYPILLFLSSWAIYMFWKLNKIVGMFLFIILCLVSFKNDLQVIKRMGQSNKIFDLKNVILDKGYTNFKFYSHNSSNMLSLPLLYLFDRDGLVNDEGGKIIAVCDNFLQVEDKCALLEMGKIMSGRVVGQNNGYKVYDLTGLDEAEIVKMGFGKMNREVVYNWLYVNYPDAK